MRRQPYGSPNKDTLTESESYPLSQLKPPIASFSALANLNTLTAVNLRISFMIHADLAGTQAKRGPFYFLSRLMLARNKAVEGDSCVEYATARSCSLSALWYQFSMMPSQSLTQYAFYCSSPHQKPHRKSAAASSTRLLLFVKTT